MRLVICVLLVNAIISPLSGEMISIRGYQFDPRLGEPQIPQNLETLWQSDYNYCLIQFSGPVREEWKDELRKLNIVFYDYIPFNAFVVQIPVQAEAQLSDFSFVAWVGPYHPAYKLCSDIGQHEFKDPERQNDPFYTLVVQAFPEADIGTVALEIQNLGGEIKEITSQFHKRVVCRVPPTFLDGIARIREVNWIEEKGEYYLTNYRHRQLTQSATRDTVLYDHGIRGENQMIAVMDEGLNEPSCFFDDDVGIGPSHRKIYDYDPYGSGDNQCCTDPYFSHGTHVCGTAAGKYEGASPNAPKWDGVGRESKIVFQDIKPNATCSNNSVYPPADLTVAFNDARTKGAIIHTNSWGGSTNTYNSYCVDVDDFMWDYPTFLILFSSGNSGPGGSTVGYPGTAKDLITVGATDMPPNQGTIATYSSRGPANDTRYKPTIVNVAGEGAASDSTWTWSAYAYSTSANCYIAGAVGTSMATPGVAGAAALVYQYYREGWYPGGTAGSGPSFTPTAALVKATIMNSCIDIGTANIPNNNEGWGRIALDNALYFSGDVRNLQIVENTTGVQTSETATYTLPVNGSAEPLEIVLVWSDYPGTNGANPAIVNNLDLTVTVPGGGTSYKGNVFSGGQSTTGGSYDNRNVEEVVLRNTPSTGYWTIQVSGASVPQGPQPFAIAVTGQLGPIVAIEEEAREEPLIVHSSIYPNPTAKSIAIIYEMIRKGDVVLKIYDASGRLVRTLVNKKVLPGSHTILWDGFDNSGATVTAGVYFYRLITDDYVSSQKIVVVR